MPQVSLSPAHIALSLAFVQHIDPRGLPFPVLPPGWSLDYEAVFYGLFTLVLFAPGAVRFRLLLAALVGGDRVRRARSAGLLPGRQP